MKLSHVTEFVADMAVQLGFATATPEKFDQDMIAKGVRFSIPLTCLLYEAGRAPARYRICLGFRYLTNHIF